MEKRKEPVLYLVLPCYNEEEIIEESAKRLGEKVTELIGNNTISQKSKIVFVNDGSVDRTEELIGNICKNNSMFAGLYLSGNVGHQNAILAGMMTVKELADIVITLDADLQQDINVLEQFIEQWENGCEIVYGIRKSRDTDSIFKKTTALIFYKLLQLLGVHVLKNHADYRLLSKRALEELSNFKEVNLFLRGLIPMIGFQSGVVYFDVSERFAGKSKYTLKKMCTLAMDGITSLSIKPIRIITSIGVLVFTFSILMVIYSIITFFQGKTVPGWTSNLCAVWSIGGIQLLSIGIVGEYIGKIYLETKQRPRYIVKSFVWRE